MFLQSNMVACLNENIHKSLNNFQIWQGTVSVSYVNPLLSTPCGLALYCLFTSNTHKPCKSTFITIIPWRIWQNQMPLLCNLSVSVYCLFCSCEYLFFGNACWWLFVFVFIINLLQQLLLHWCADGKAWVENGCGLREALLFASVSECTV